MTDSPGKPIATSTELKGVFLHYDTGRSHTYVAKFLRSATILVWSARVKVGSDWVRLRGGQIGCAKSESDFAASELVRDCVCDCLYDPEMDDCMARAHKRQRRTARVISYAAVIVALCAAIGSVWLALH